MMDDHEINRIATPLAKALGLRNQVRTLVLMALTLGGLYCCYLLSLPFLSALVWALALAVVLTPLDRWLEKKLRSANLAAAVTVLVAGLLVVLVVTFVGQKLAQEVASGAALLKTKVESGEWRQSLETHPRWAPLVNWTEHQNLPGTVKSVATWLTTTGASFVKGSVVELVEILLTFYLLFFFLRDRRTALHFLRSLSPLPEEEMSRFLSRADDTILATVYGTLAVAAVQGLLGGLMFWFLGLQSPLLWGVVMALLSVVPALGAFVVWIPAALLLAIQGSWGQALVLTIWGAVVVGTIDNLLRPILVGRRLKQHTVLVFISVVGGLILFGPCGLILGPLALTATGTLLEIWSARSVARLNAGQNGEASSNFEDDGGAEPLMPKRTGPMKPS